MRHLLLDVVVRLQQEAPREILFLCVARRTDRAIIAHYQNPAPVSRSAATPAPYLDNVKRVLESPGWANVTTDKLTLNDGDNRLHVLIDTDGRTFVAISTAAYPVRYVYDSSSGSQSTEGVLGGTCRRCVRERTSVQQRCRAAMLASLCAVESSVAGVGQLIQFEPCNGG